MSDGGQADDLGGVGRVDEALAQERRDRGQHDAVAVDDQVGRGGGRQAGVREHAVVVVGGEAAGAGRGEIFTAVRRQDRVARAAAAEIARECRRTTTCCRLKRT